MLSHAHPSLLPLYGVVEPASGGLFLVLKHGKCGSLRDVLRAGGWRGRGRAAPRKLVAHVGLTVASGLAYLHALSPPVVYRDVKPGNIIMSGSHSPLLDPEYGAVREILFHLVYSRTIGRGAMTSASGANVVDAVYHAPESLHSGGEWAPPSDVYSLGMTLADALCGAAPFPNASVADVARALSAGERPALPPDTHAGLAAAVRACWAQDPAARPTARELVDVFAALAAEFAGDDKAPTAAAAAAVAAAAGAGPGGGPPATPPMRGLTASPTASFTAAAAGEGAGAAGAGARGGAGGHGGAGAEAAHAVSLAAVGRRTGLSNATFSPPLDE